MINIIFEYLINFITEITIIYSSSYSNNITSEILVNIQNINFLTVSANKIFAIYDFGIKDSSISSYRNMLNHVKRHESIQQVLIFI